MRKESNCKTCKFLFCQGKSNPIKTCTDILRNSTNWVIQNIQGHSSFLAMKKKQIRPQIRLIWQKQNKHLNEIIATLHNKVATKLSKKKLAWIPLRTSTRFLTFGDRFSRISVCSPARFWSLLCKPNYQNLKSMQNKETKNKNSGSHRPWER